MATMSEQETTVTQLRNHGTRIYTANPVHLRALRKKVVAGSATELRGDDEFGEFEIPAGGFDPLKGFKRKAVPISVEERARRSEAMKNLQAAQRAKA